MENLKDLTLGELLKRKGNLIRRNDNYEKPINYYNELEAINEAIKTKSSNQESWDDVISSAGVYSSDYYFTRLVQHLKDNYLPPIKKIQ